MATDSPDWQEVVTLVSGGSVPDAPDWQRTVTGPGATPVANSWPTARDYQLQGSDYSIPVSNQLLAELTVAVAVGVPIFVTGVVFVEYSTTGADENVQVFCSGMDYQVFGSTNVIIEPGVAVSNSYVSVQLSFFDYGHSAVQTYSLYVTASSSSVTGTALAINGIEGDCGLFVLY